jgi:GTPase
MRSAMIAVVGRPNVGKSSLVNALVGRKVSIVSHKPQTTRHQIQGVVHDARGQLVFVDTPGLHLGGKRALNRAMNDAALAALEDIDLVLFVVDGLRWTDEDQQVLERLQSLATPVALVVNKIDRIDDKSRLLPLLQGLQAKRDFAFIVPVSALRRTQLDALRDELFAHAEEGPALYPDDMVVGYDSAFALTELIREKLVRNLHKELPYATAVGIERWQIEGRLDRVHAVIWVEREGQKGIVVGDRGLQLKKIGEAARKEYERTTGRKLFLQLWCRVKENWSDDPRVLSQFGLGPVR